MGFEACVSSAERWWDQAGEPRDGKAAARRRAAGGPRRLGREVQCQGDAALDELSAEGGGRLPSDLLAGLAERLRVAELG